MATRCLHNLNIYRRFHFNHVFFTKYFTFMNYSYTNMMETDKYNVDDATLSEDLPDKNENVIKEGSAEILVPSGIKVFYNPVQEFNRDLSVAVLEVMSKRLQECTDKQKEKSGGFRILEALSATGLRSIRYAKEVPNVQEVVANDISLVAVNHIERNCVHNGVEHIVKTSHKDAVEVMFENRHWKQRFDAVDLDPYGCPTPFLDAAVQCVKDNGVLLVTCTDMAVLCGTWSHTCYAKYGAMSLRHHSCHEMALRIVLQCIEAHANKYKRYITPLLAVSVDFYVRVFVRINTGADVCKQTTSKLSMMYECNGCQSLTLQPLGTTISSKKGNKYILPHSPVLSPTCEHCGGFHQMGGPIWSAPIHDTNFVSDLLSLIKTKDAGTQKRLMGVVSMIDEELPDVPLFYNVSRLCSVVKGNVIPMITLRSALLNSGYRVSYSHANKLSIKTDAPIAFIWDVLRSWVHQNAENAGKKIDASTLPEGSAARRILSIPPSGKVDFSLRPDANPMSRIQKLVRFQENPLPFWGPGSRGGNTLQQPEKKVKNQNKRKRMEQSTRSEEDRETKSLKEENVLNSA